MTKYRNCGYEKIYEVVDEEGSVINHVYSAWSARKEIDNYLKQKRKAPIPPAPKGAGILGD